MNELIVETTDDSFEADILQSENPVLLDFWAEWCAPCKMIAPLLDEVAGEYEGRVTVAKVNIDENPKAPQRYGVRGIPALILFKNGAVEAQRVGVLSKTQLTQFLDENL